jgi:predicted  nucleic acid-binding Zn-ribbon protein
MVAIKQEMNMGEDIIDINALKAKKQTKLDAETDSTKQQVLTKEIGDLNERLISVAQAKSALATTITELTAKVTETSALALTIDATIADEEAAIALDAAQQAIDDIHAQMEQFDMWIEEARTY